MARRWEVRPAPKRKRRRVERLILGSGMAFVAWVLERRVVRGLKRKGLDDEFRGGDYHATAERAED